MNQHFNRFNQLALICLSSVSALLAPAAFGQAQPRTTVIKQGVEGRVYAPGPFERIELAGSADVRLLQGSEDQVFIAGDAELQDSVMVKLSRGRLDIRSTEGWKFWPTKRLQIDVTMRQLQELVLSGASDLHAPGAVKTGRLAIRISGAGSARFDDLTAERLDFGISGAGDGVLRGQVEQLDLRISGKGRLQAEDLHADSASIRISGIGNADVWVSEKLNLSISGVGRIDYWGQPMVTRSTSGIATVNARGDRRMAPATPATPAGPVAPAMPAPLPPAPPAMPAPPQRSPSQ